MFYPHCSADFVKPDEGPPQTETSLRMYYFKVYGITLFLHILLRLHKTLDENLAVWGSIITFSAISQVVMAIVVMLFNLVGVPHCNRSV